MAVMRRVMRRLRQWLRPDLVEAAIEAEMRDHLDREIAERMGQGASRTEATRLAMRDFGGVDRYKEEARDVVGFRILDDTSRDLQYTTRLLRRSPSFTSAVVLTFALGIGCTAAIFTLVNGILIRPLPYARPNELVALWERNITRGVDRNVVSVSLFEAWRDQSRSFSAVAAMVPAPLTLQGATAERITGAQVSASYFRVLGAHPAIGRDFTNADELNGGAAVTILSDALWRSRYGADRGIVGRALIMDGTSYTIIGVMPTKFEPPTFGWMTEHPLWIPFAPTAGNRNWGRFLHVIGRLRPDVTVAQGRAELESLSERRERAGESNVGWSATVVPLREQITGDVQRPLLMLFAAVVLLLLMAIVNVANLVTTFMRRREPELALRRAIGATRWRLLRQQLTLSLALGLLATAVGMAVAFGATRALVALLPPDVPRLVGAHVDATVLAFVLVVSGLTTLVVGGTSAANSIPSPGALMLAGARATARFRGARLVAAEIAIGLVLSVLAALMVRSFAKLGAVDLGFQPTHVAVARISLPGSKYATDVQQRQFFDALVARTREIPGVVEASVATTSPFACCAPATNARDAARAADPRAPSPTTDVRYVDSHYFSVLRIPVLGGAVFSEAEPSDGAPRAVVSRSLAHTLWGTANPIGKRVSLTLYGTTTAEVIGVVGDVRHGDARTAPRPAAYISTNRFPSIERDLIVRGSSDASSLIAPLRDALGALDRSVPLYRAGTLTETVDRTLAQERFVTALLSAFAVVALLLAAVGVHGVLAGDVARRRKEIGIRVALGASRTSVYALVVRRMLAPSLAGLAVGVAGALVLSRAMSALVFGIGTSDPASFASVVGILAVVAILATWAAALRAIRVSPLEAIRTD